MATIKFLPDRLNAEPVVFRGFNTPELGLAALTGVLSGFVLSLPFAFLFGWLAIPTGTLLFPLVFIAFGGKWLASKKRGKPENYLWQQFELKKCRMGLGDISLIIHSRGWSLQRSKKLRSSK
ncbi:MULTISPECIES: TIGR03750 family conjugal transfer protein [unclassified Pantoea]|uniref:TIGR03750 family conjugal transfer protein n=1 Tax=unclassified Pantoea TaxID=2630326 RepID=UPI001CD4FB7F|nr:MULTISPECIES: TIGR03750 family conjugal transfer protein [unclassified Pantoea]MCA1179526.1 TIGR03750 family conjugal transfer protein [Pantoea sp. alder69]MCA1251779.1 TIGR03750 family conjugal transfer protein [Pantoea sp. alder70]MCA1267884.1 TIGR03750 family conjugal transfer protein [Pantoea sp. alder81]